MSPRQNAKPHGQIRQSQIVTTFGPGAPVDLPKKSVLVGGLDDWSPGGVEIDEPRLVAKILRVLEMNSLRLVTPPPDRENPLDPQTGITAWQFPEWFITQDVQKDRATGYHYRYLVHRTSVPAGRFVDADKEKHHVVPIRFVRACPNGHIGDIDWYGYVHRGKSECRRQLYIDERGTTGDLAEVWVRCDCGLERSLNEAAFRENLALGYCDGNRPWLGARSHEACGQPNRLLVRSASNAYFPQTMSVISIPDRDEQLAQVVGHFWEAHLQYVDDLDDLKHEIKKKPPVRDGLKGYSEEEVLAEILARKGGGTSTATAKSVKQLELETLMSSKDELGSDKPDGDFYARCLPKDASWPSLLQHVERIVLVHRLREVVAQVGFTRFEATTPDVEGELEIGVKRAALARELRWVPAVENRGEGVFIQFNKEAVEEWLRRPEAIKREAELNAGFLRWLDDHPGVKRNFFGLPYIMLHSLSHLLITAVSLECGYPASSIRERVYSLPSTGYGILLYTGSPDAEGTLGGLVETGRRMAHHLRTALELGTLCSNDPVCAQHNPADTHERRFLHGAACHGCLLIAETSCEVHNDFLDRALVVPTVEHRGAEFFETMSNDHSTA